MEPSATGTPSVSSEQFVKSLSESGLFAVADVRQFVGKVPTKDPRKLALELVKQQKLTRYQATRLLTGKSKGLVLGKYAILEPLGEGGMGVVYKARHLGLNRVVALKVLPPELTIKQTALKRFRREVQAAAKLHHPNIVAALDAGEAKGVHFLVMDYVKGCDLSQWVKKNGPLPMDRAVDCIFQSAQGLAYAHAAGIIHRDIKPSNLLLAEAPGSPSVGLVKILDMGLARIDKAGNSSGNETVTDELTQTGSIMGTCDYMAPEQAMNVKTADRRADIYSLGCTLYYLLTGKTMYGGETGMEKVFAHRENPIPPLPGASKTLEAVFRRMVAKQPEDRYQSMADLIADLQMCVGKPARRKGAWIWWLGGAAAAVIVVAALAMRGHTDNPPAVAVPPTHPTAIVPPVQPTNPRAQPDFKWTLAPATRDTPGYKVIEMQPKDKPPDGGGLGRPSRSEKPLAGQSEEVPIPKPVSPQDQEAVRKQLDALKKAREEIRTVPPARNPTNP
jgi:hypothetical protein